jgi:hypothetical protein
MTEARASAAVLADAEPSPGPDMGWRSVCHLQCPTTLTVVGGGRYIVVEPGRAEIAFAVIDQYQGQASGPL